MHSGLERELASVFQMQPLHGARIERLVQEIAATARAIARFNHSPRSAASCGGVDNLDQLNARHLRLAKERV